MKKHFLKCYSAWSDVKENEAENEIPAVIPKGLHYEMNRVVLEKFISGEYERVRLLWSSARNGEKGSHQDVFEFIWPVMGAYIETHEISMRIPVPVFFSALRISLPMLSHSVEEEGGIYRECINRRDEAEMRLEVYNVALKQFCEKYGLVYRPVTEMARKKAR